MTKRSITKAFHLKAFLGLLGLLAMISWGGVIGVSAKNTQSTHTTSPARSTFWLQTMDSCQQGLPNAFFLLTGNGLHIPLGPTSGTKPVTIGRTTQCPLERGNCSVIIAGCLSVSLPVPAMGTRTYTIKETQSPATYMPCTGGSVCPGGPVVITVHINNHGQFSANALNIYPDRKSVTWPTIGQPYTATISDPVVVHNFGIGTISCDGDNDADDHLTGSPSGHCDSDPEHGLRR